MIASSTSPSRRAIIGLAATAGTVALAGRLDGTVPVSWSARDWMDRWRALGCDLEVSGNALQLRGRLDGDRAAIGAMMVEIAPVARQAAVINLVEEQVAWFRPEEDAALRVVRELEAIDAQFISEDIDPAANAAWIARWDRAFDRLPGARATTGAGRAAKLRYAIEYMDTPRGDELMQQVLRYLEIVT